MTEAYPLQWPMGWPRSDRTARSNFGNYTFERMRQEVMRELKLLHATDIIISSNLRLRADGFPYSNQRSPEDVGIAVYFKLDGEEQCIPCDKWHKVEDNMRAIAKTIEALRGIERWGAKEMVNAAFRGFKALPSSIITPEPTRPHRDWWVVLGLRDQGATVDEVRAAYREALKLHHPDVGGSEADFKEVQQAYEEWKQW